jgi:hypothetical protein
VQLVIPAPDNPEIHMDHISIDDESESSSDDIEFDKASLFAPIIDDTRISHSGQETRTPSDSPISSDDASDVRLRSAWISTYLIQLFLTCRVRTKPTPQSTIRQCPALQSVHTLPRRSPNHAPRSINQRLRPFDRLLALQRKGVALPAPSTINLQFIQSLPWIPLMPIQILPTLKTLYRVGTMKDGGLLVMAHGYR